MWTPADRAPSASPRPHPCFAEYGPDGGLVAVEFAPPALPALAGTMLFGPALGAASDLLAAHDPGLERDDAGCVSRGLGIALWGAAGDGEPAQGVLVFAPGYL